MWFPFRLFLYIPSTSTRPLRFEGCKLDRFRIQIEEQGPPTVGTSITRSLLTGSYTYLAKDPMERTVEASSPDSLLPASVSVAERPVWSNPLSQSLSSDSPSLSNHPSLLLYRFTTTQPCVRISVSRKIESLTAVNVWQFFTGH